MAKYKLKDCFLLIKNGAVIQQRKGAVGYPITRIETLSNGRFNRDRMGYADIFDITPYKDYVLDDCDILMSHINSREFLGRTVLYRKENDETFIHGMNVLRIKTNPELLDAQYANYLFQTSYFKKLIDSIRKDAINQSSIAISDICGLELDIPTIKEQRQIAAVLSTLDDKIALNRAINDNLEAMAKQLYDYWFVQFDFPNEEGKPYKSSGGKMVWNEKLKRKIPEGWEVKTIGTFADVKRGSTITKAQTVEGNIKVVAAATDYSFLHNEANRSAYVITVSASGANAGFINFWREPIYASDCSTIQCEKIEETLYCYYWILHFQELLFTQQIGAAQPHVYPEHINKIPIVVPSPGILAKVKNLLVKSNQKQSEISREIESFTKQRDELLPLLMNGQVSVNYHLSHD